MICVLGGTQDSREIIRSIADSNYPVMASVATAYGRQLIDDERVMVNDHTLDCQGMIDWFGECGISMVIDATHPYARDVSTNAIQACAALSIPYLRYEREEVPLPDYARLHTVETAAEAARLSAGLGEVIFLTTGSRSLGVFRQEPLLAAKRIIARVLPDPAVIAECFRLGFTPRDVVAMQGPFSRELNIQLFREYRTQVIVTKNSGTVGGSDTKLKAAMDLELPIVVIDRPKVIYPCIVHSVEDVLRFIGQRRQSDGIYHRTPKN
ncbi:precorrin-6A reductase [Acetonema longum]|uniref:Precorrin-6x reductase n=1 Tax=Acetonema longum DSM 6540 TaxID=1009370 RepID=F7NPX3_9FIRM|nr:precorrin-6A reductase [Acetonema longum]EGO61964.1 precorrin-6x reductase [Acetonema longum DSM 6540]